MAILGIETSCDDTGVALCKNGKIIFSMLSSQEEFHSRFGGIVPEIASRKHLEVLPVMIHELKRKIDLKKVKGIAVTEGPGLIGSLLVGVKMAEGIAMGLGVPIVGIDHLMAHATSILLEKKVEFPYIALLISGGHTSLYLVKDYTDMELLGETRDDACGEAFDKVAKMLGLGYPGGPIIEKLASEGNRSFKFPIPDLGKDSLDFSFSGLKTAVMKKINELSELDEKSIKDIARSFQDTVSEILKMKVRKSVEALNVRRVVICGGVAANSKIREEIENEGKRYNFEVFFPSPRLCTDNADMIAFLGEIYLSRGIESTPPLNPYPN